MGMMTPPGLLIKLALLPLATLAYVEVAKSGPRCEGHGGYVEDVEKERGQRVVEVLGVTDPSAGEPSLSARIFDPTIVRDLEEEYRRKFGRTEIDEAIRAPNRFTEIEYSPGSRITADEDVARRQAFGEFMVLKLSEYHLDQYLKNDESMRTVYETKEMLSKASVSVSPGYKFLAKYSISGGNIGLTLDNPHSIRNRIVLGGGDSAVFSIGYPLSKALEVGSDYRLDDAAIEIYGRRRISESLTASISGLASDRGDLPGQRFIVGLHWTN